MTTSIDSSLTCRPRFATPRTSRPTLGPRAAEVGGRIIGSPLMPWQRHVLDVALELGPGGLPAYRRVVLTVPRQSGKTTLQLALFVHRALAWDRPQVMAYAAQTGKDARKKLIDPPNGQIPMLLRSPFRSLFRPRYTNGHEAVLWRNGSRHTLAANTEKSGHGDTLDLGFIDEAFSQVDARLEQAMSPAMATRPDAQLWIVSTAGSELSTYLRAKVNAGRDTCEDTDSGTAYLEWSAEDDVDIDEAREWYRWMPALGITVSEAFVRSELVAMRSEGNEDEWRRAYGNQWRDRSNVPVDNGLPGYASALTTERRPASPFTVCVQVAADSRSASIAVHGGGVAEVTDFRTGPLGWVVPRAIELRDRWSARLAACRGTPTEQLSLPEGTVWVPQSERATACMTVARLVNEGELLLWDSRVDGRRSPLDIAVGNAVRAWTGDVWRWSLSKSAAERGTDISPLLACTWAAHVGGGGRAPMTTKQLLNSFG